MKELLARIEKLESENADLRLDYLKLEQRVTDLESDEEAGGVFFAGLPKRDKDYITKGLAKNKEGSK